MSSLQLTTPLILSGDPTQPRHASTKQYVDMVLGHPNAMGFTSGTIPVAKLPALTGVVSSDAGDNVLTLNNSGVTPGTYTKVTVSSGGRITAGTSISEDEIQSVDWSRITSGKPTTLAGYGITDVLPSTGGTITGSLKLTQPPSDNLHPVTKAYVDNSLITGDTSLATGDIIRKPTSVTPSGFLRLNGGVASKTTYADLYEKIGDTFSEINRQGSGKPWLFQYDISLNDDGTWSNYQSTNFPVRIALATGFVTSSYSYIVGGLTFDGSSYSHNGKVYRSNSGGAQGTWYEHSSFPVAATEPSDVFFTKNRVYFLYKGWLLSTTIDGSGLIGTTWADHGTVVSLYESNKSTTTIVTKNRVYIFNMHFVYSATINSDGTLSAFSVVQDRNQGYPFDGIVLQAFVIGNKVCLMGFTGSRDPKWYLYRAAINSDGSLGKWSYEPRPDLNNFKPYGNRFTPLVTGKYLYLFGSWPLSGGGWAGVKSPIDSEQNLTGFVNFNPFMGYRGGAIFVTGNRINCVGGYDINGGYPGNISSFQHFSGGSNDYSQYYTPSSLVSDYFSLPDYSSREGHKLCYYIKT